MIYVTACWLPRMYFPCAIDLSNASYPGDILALVYFCTLEKEQPSVSQSNLKIIREKFPLLHWFIIKFLLENDSNFSPIKNSNQQL